MTGNRPLRNGVWATCWGRSILRPDEKTVAELFRDNGYATGLFGKWHLGDNYPYRPQDRGFERVVAHKGGGVGQTPDFWGNNYFDDTYFHNGEPVVHAGYCTDVWFDEATKFIEENKERPFFAYLSTNAPHLPYLVDERYAKPYRDNPEIVNPEFYGMITNIDENFGKLRDYLRINGLENNTILMFMTDNGSSGCGHADKDEFISVGYNAGMRGKKASYYDGGHRVPFFIRWPDGGIGGGKDVNTMGLHIDFFPTMAELCDLHGFDWKIDGISLVPLMYDHTLEAEDRYEFVQFHQGTEPPEKWENAVLSQRWRLIRGIELYDIKSDMGQLEDLAEQYPGIVKQLRAAHESWWQEVSPQIAPYSPIILGDVHENPTRLDAMDVMGDVTWNQAAIAQAKRSAGRWTVEVSQQGKYRVRLKRWPDELGKNINELLPQQEIDALAQYQPPLPVRETLYRHARLRVFDAAYTRDVVDEHTCVEFVLDIKQCGTTILEAEFVDETGNIYGAYYVYIERII